MLTQATHKIQSSQCVFHKDSPRKIQEPTAFKLYLLVIHGIALKHGFIKNVKSGSPAANSEGLHCSALDDLSMCRSLSRTMYLQLS